MGAVSEFYAIASHRRAETLERKTLPLLARLGVDLGQVDVWVDADEVDDYGHLGLTVRPIYPGGDGPPYRVGAARNAIARGYPKWSRVIEIDDDVTKVSVGWKGTKLRPVEPDEWRAVLDYAWATCELYGLWLWGPYPVFNDYFMRPNATTDLRYATGTLFGTILRFDPCELVVTDDKEDFERNMRHTLRDGGLLRLNWLAYDTNYYGEPGGMQSYRTPETVEAGARTLAGLFPGLCSYAGRVGKMGNPEVRLHRKGTGVTSPLPLPDWLRAE
jgi:hypothetical protein